VHGGPPAMVRRGALRACGTATTIAMIAGRAKPDVNMTVP
jgi:hypothetical protein